MNKLFFVIMLFSTICYSHEYDFKDLNDKKYSSFDDGVVKNNNGRTIYLIQKDDDGDVFIKNRNGRRMGKIEKRDKWNFRIAWWL